MYVIQDRVTPKLHGFMNLLRTKNIVLRHWPTKWIDNLDNTVTETTPDAVKIFDRLYFYNGNIIEDEVHKKLYHLLNINVDDLKDSEYEGVEKAWIELIWKESTGIELPIENMENYIDQQLPISSEGYSEWITVSNIIYDPLDTSAPAYVSDADIYNRIRTERINVHYDITNAHEFLALVLMDRDNEFFEVVYNITNKHLKQNSNLSNTTSHYLLSASLDITFRRKIATGTSASDSYLNKLKTFIEALDDYNNSTIYQNSTNLKVTSDMAEVSRTLSVNKQLYGFLEDIIPVSESALVYPAGNFKKTNYIKYSGMEELNSHSFTDALKKVLNTDFKEEEAEWWEELLLAVVVIAIIVISGGYALTAAGAVTGTLAQTLAFASTMAMGLAIGQLTLSLAAKLFANRGNYGMAAAIGDSLSILGMLSTALGIIALIGTAYSKFVNFAASSLGKTITTEATSSIVTNVGGTTAAIGTEVITTTTTSLVDKLFDAAQELVTGYIKKNLSGPLDFITGFVTDAFNMYTKYIEPPNKGLNEQQALIDEQKEELEQLSATQDSIKKVYYLYETPYANIFDFNEYMQNVPYLMTQGKIENSLTKYYS